MLNIHCNAKLSIQPLGATVSWVLLLGLYEILYFEKEKSIELTNGNMYSKYIKK